VNWLLEGTAGGELPPAGWEVRPARFKLPFDLDAAFVLLLLLLLLGKI